MEQPKRIRRVDLSKFKQLVQAKLPAIQRFKIDSEHYAVDVPKMLRICYINEVQRRHRVFVDDEDTRAHIEKVAKWLTVSTRPGLLLYGGIGNGKTTMANAIADVIRIVYYDSSSMERSKSVSSISALDVARMAQEDTAQALRSLAEREIVHIDDVGTEPASVKVWGNEVSPIVELIYRRYDRLLCTIITSNLDDAEILKRYGPRVSDRLHETFDFLAYDNKSYR